MQLKWWGGVRVRPGSLCSEKGRDRSCEGGKQVEVDVQEVRNRNERGGTPYRGFEREKLRLRRRREFVPHKRKDTELRQTGECEQSNQ